MITDSNLLYLQEWLEGFRRHVGFAAQDRNNLVVMNKLSKLFGNPENKFKSIHVTGSKGKGTIATYVAKGLAETGLKVGLFVSPHVEFFSERVCSASGPFSEDIYYRSFLRLIDGVENALNKGIFRKE